MLYNAFTLKGEFIMCAPLAVIARHYGARREAMDRVTAAGQLPVTWHGNGRHDDVIVKYANVEVPTHEVPKQADQFQKRIGALVDEYKGPVPTGRCIIEAHCMDMRDMQVNFEGGQHWLSIVFKDDSETVLGLEDE